MGRAAGSSMHTHQPCKAPRLPPSVPGAGGSRRIARRPAAPKLPVCPSSASSSDRQFALLGRSRRRPEPIHQPRHRPAACETAWRHLLAFLDNAARRPAARSLRAAGDLGCGPGGGCRPWGGRRAGQLGRGVTLVAAPPPLPGGAAPPSVHAPREPRPTPRAGLHGPYPGGGDGQARAAHPWPLSVHTGT